MGSCKMAISDVGNILLTSASPRCRKVMAGTPKGSVLIGPVKGLNFFDDKSTFRDCQNLPSKEASVYFGVSQRKNTSCSIV